MGKTGFLLFFLFVLAIALFLAANQRLLGLEQKSNSDFETVRSQITSAKSAVVSYPVIDYSQIMVFGTASFLAGIAVGLTAVFFTKK